jgi:hypothetical protein
MNEFESTLSLLDTFAHYSPTAIPELKRQIHQAVEMLIAARIKEATTNEAQKVGEPIPAIEKVLDKLGDEFDQDVIDYYRNPLYDAFATATREAYKRGVDDTTTKLKGEQKQ